MSVIKDIENRLGTTSREFTKDSMNQDFSYEMAERLTALLLEKGFITDTERQKISRLNKETFQPFYKELMD